jgi:hypothetical protein
MFEIRVRQTKDGWTSEIYIVQSNGGTILTKESQIYFKSADLAFKSAMYIIDCVTYVDHHHE